MRPTRNRRAREPYIPNYGERRRCRQYIGNGHAEKANDLIVLLLESLPDVFIGSKLCARLPDTWLHPAMAGALLFAGTRLV